VALISSIDYRRCEALLRDCGARGFVLNSDPRLRRPHGLLAGTRHRAYARGLWTRPAARGIIIFG
jgi:hypothetical protein